MKYQFTVRRVLGIILVVVAALSLVINVVAIYQVWSAREPVTQGAISTLDLLDSTLDTTAQGLVVVKTSLASVTATIGVLQKTVGTAAGSISDAGTAVTSLTGIVGQNLTGTVNAALGTLKGLSDTTRTIDDFLGSISKLPLVNLGYNPQQPLSGTVTQLTDNLAQVPDSLKKLETNLQTSGSSLATISQQATDLAGSLGKLQSDLSQLVAVIEQYQQQVAAFQQTVKLLRENIVGIIWGIVLGLTFLLLWTGATMLIVLFKGLEWMGIKIRFPDDEQLLV